MPDTGYWGRFVLAMLATWRVTHLLAEEDGPGDAVVRVRAQLGSGWLAGLMDCFYCLSLWVAVPLGVATTRRRGGALVTSLALSGAACLLERTTGERGTDALLASAGALVAEPTHRPCPGAVEALAP
jgi:hypothetical protein